MKITKPEYLTSKELFINMKNPPQYNPKKSYWEQSTDVIQFYEEEIRKITEGVMIGGYFIHPLLYYNINFFHTPIPTRTNFGRMEEVIRVPPLTDNFLYFVDTYHKCEELGLGMYMFGARGVHKTTNISSVTTWLNTTKPNGTTTITGGSDPDLKQISKTVKVALTNMHPALYVPTLVNDWDKQVEIGLKLKDNVTRFTHSYLQITNADAGKDKKSEKGAGGNPVGYILDEGGKWDPRELLRSALPSFMTPEGAKLVHILAGTSGNDTLSKASKEMLGNPEAYRLLPMDWERLERGIPEEAITWKESKKDRFSIFVPGHMSTRLDVQKVETSLADVVGINSKELKEIKVFTTDWKKASERINQMIAEQTDEDGKDKVRMYFPQNIDDIWLTSGENPFPVSLITRRIKELKEDQKYKPVMLEIYNSKTTFVFSDNKIADLEYNGGAVDAPIKMYMDVPETPPAEDVFVSGMDYYKLEQAEDGSLGSLYVLKRRNLEPNSPCERIAASYTARPYRQDTFDKNCRDVIRAWNAECNLESADLGFQKYLDQKGESDKYLCKAFTFTKTKDGRQPTLNSRYGLYPTAQNNSYRLKATVEWTKEEHIIGVDEDGNQIIKYGVDFIDDIELLQEMATFKKGGNYDRIAAFSHALVYAQKLDEQGVVPKKENMRNYDQKPKVNPNTRRQFFSNRRVNPF